MKAIVAVSTDRDVDTLARWVNAAVGITEVVAVSVVPKASTVLGPLGEHWPGWRKDRQRLMDLAAKRASGLVEKFAAAVSVNDTDVRTIVLHGDSATKIIETASRERAQIILLGAIGARRSKRRRGRVATRVARYAKTSVLIVNARVDAPAVVVFATDGSDAARRGESVLQALAFTDLRHINTCVAVDDYIPPFATGYSPGDVQRVRSQLRDWRFRDGLDIARSAAEDLRGLATVVDSEVSAGSPEGVIMSTSDKVRSDLLVLGARGATTRLGFLLGSVSLTMLERCKSSLLLSR